MRGDFSRWDDRQTKKYSGVLHQQGRVLLDSDWNDQVALQEYWKGLLGRDVIGPQVVAVPAAARDSLQMEQVARDAQGNVTVTLHEGRAWVDGLLVQNPGLGPQWKAPVLSGYNSAQSEAVILRCWQQEVSAFQDEVLLLEKALGGPDTTERMENVFALWRIPASGKNCEELRDDMGHLIPDDPTKKIKLNVQFQQTSEMAVDGSDCPAVQAGGYRGLEHNLYRIEMAEVNDGKLDPKGLAAPFFKWSHLNGGIAGCGYFKKKGVDNHNADIVALVPTKNIEALRRSGLDRLENCYLETYTQDPQTKLWSVEFGAVVTFDGDNHLLVNDIYKGAKIIDVDGAGNGTEPPKRFFRLWSGIKSVNAFKTDWTQLRDGIYLKFDSVDGHFFGGDYWAFEVRANAPGDRPDNFSAAAAVPPQGPVYHSACLGIVDWQAASGVETIAKEKLHDCRKIFDPLVDLDNGCCIEVSPQEDLSAAVEQIRKAGGGCICLLPGRHVVRETLDFTATRGVFFKGVGPVCELVLHPEFKSDCVFLLDDASNIRFQGFSLILDEVLPKNIWQTQTTFSLSICEVQLLCPFSAKEEKGTVPLQGKFIEGLELRSNIWFSWQSLKVGILTDAVIENNWFMFGDIGVSAAVVAAVQVRNNRLTVIPGNLLESSLKRFFAAFPKESLRISALFAAVVSGLGIWISDEGADPLQTNIFSAGLQFFVGLQTDVERNLISAARGVQSLILFDGQLRRNRLTASLFGFHNLWAADGLTLSENIFKGAMHKPMTVAIQFGGKASGVRVLDNDIVSAVDGVVFETASQESLLMQSVATAYRYAKKDDEDKLDIAALRGKIVEESREEIKEIAELLKKQAADAAHNEGSVKVTDLFAMVSALMNLKATEMPVEDLTIQGNTIQASWNGIEISGKRAVQNYSVNQNRVSGCEGAALFLPGENFSEADETVNELRPIDYRKSVLTNKILCKGVALWCLQNEIRIEGNDIRVMESQLSVASWFKSIFEISPDWAEISAALGGESASSANDKEVFDKLLKALIKAGQEQKLTSLANNPQSPWSMGFKMLNLKDDDEHLRAGQEALAIKILTLMMASLRGFAVGIWGVESTLRLNRIEVQSQAMIGGVILGSLSGEIVENDIEAEKVGLSMVEDREVLRYAEKKMSRTFSPPVQISGNRFTATAAADDAGDAGIFSLLVPRILSGDLSVTDNHFSGDVHIGANLDFEVDKKTWLGKRLGKLNKGAEIIRYLGGMKAILGRNKVVLGNAERRIHIAREDVREETPGATTETATRNTGIPLYSLARERRFFPQSPKILFANNQVQDGSVSILPFTFKVTGEDAKGLPQIELVTSETDQMPMVTFNSNQLNSGDQSSFIFGYQVMIAGNQTLIEGTLAGAAYSLVGLAWKNEYLYAKGNMPEAYEAHHV